MDLEDLKKRLAVVDGFIPSTLVLRSIAEHQDRVKEARLWRRLFVGCVVVAIIATSLLVVEHVHTSSVLAELVVYRQRCLDISAAEEIVQTSDASSKMALRCLALHEENFKFYQVMMSVSQSDDATNVCAPLSLEPLALTSISE